LVLDADAYVENLLHSKVVLLEGEIYGSQQPLAHCYKTSTNTVDIILNEPKLTYENSSRKRYYVDSDRQ